MEELKTIINHYVAEKPNPSFEELVPIIHQYSSNNPDINNQAFACLLIHFSSYINSIVTNLDFQRAVRSKQFQSTFHHSSFFPF